MKRFVLFSLIVALIIGFIGCAKNPENVKIGYFPVSGDLAFFVAYEKGFFKEQGIEVEPVKFGNGQEAMNALLTGRVDLIAPIGFTTIFAVEQNKPGLLKIFLPGGEGEGHVVSQIIVRKDLNIKTIKDLRGRKIGCPTGTAHRMWFELMLRKMGFDPKKDVTIIQVDRKMLVPALASGEYDAFYATEPHTTVAMEKGIGVSLVDNPRSKYIMNPFLSGSFVFPTKFIKRNPKLAKKIYLAFKKALKFIKEHPYEAKKLLPKYTALDEKLAQKTHIHAIYDFTKEIIAVIQKEADLLYKYKLLEKKINVKSMILQKEDLR